MFWVSAILSVCMERMHNTSSLINLLCKSNIFLYLRSNLFFFIPTYSQVVTGLSSSIPCLSQLLIQSGFELYLPHKKSHLSTIDLEISTDSALVRGGLHFEWNPHYGAWQQSGRDFESHSDYKTTAQSFSSGWAESKPTKTSDFTLLLMRERFGCGWQGFF